MKLHTHDAGFRVAGIMRWPQRIRAGMTSSEPVSSLDFLPTFCKLAGVNPPEELELDGIDFSPVLAPNGKLPRSKPLTWVYFNAINEARVAMRFQRLKVLARLNGGKFPRISNVTTKQRDSVSNAKLTDFEIYDVVDDVSESTNLADGDSPAIQALKGLLNKQYQDLVGDSHTWTPTK